MTMEISENALDHRARRAAERVGLFVRKSRWRRDSVDNHGGYMILDPYKGVVAGARFDMTADDVIVF
jgi:hypothetical protein